MPSTNFAALPNNVLHMIYGQLPPRKSIFLSQTCQQLRHAATTLPNKFKREVTLTMENIHIPGYYGLVCIPARKLSSINRDKFEFFSQHSGFNPEPWCDIQELFKSCTSPVPLTSIRGLIDALGPMVTVTSLQQFTIITYLPDLVRLNWFDVIRAITGNKHQPYRLILDLGRNAQSHCDTFETLPESLHSSVEVARRVAFTVILWNIARTGIRWVNIRYVFSYRLFNYIRLDWFSHLALWLIVFPFDFTKKSLRAFEKFIRKYLEGGFKGSSFDFIFMVPVGAEMKKRYNPFITQLENVRKELGQSETICYHQSEAGVNVVWRTMNKGQYRVSWQGPFIEDKLGGLHVEVQGMVDSDDAIPRTRKLTPALQRQMEGACRFTVGK